MAKIKENVFKKSRSLGEQGRRSDKSYLEEMKSKIKEDLAAKPETEETEKPAPAPKTKAKPKANKQAKSKKQKPQRTTATMSQAHFEKLNHLLFTIKGSGQNHIVPEGDFNLKGQDFWEFAIDAVEEKVKKVYGEIKAHPKYK